MSIPILTRAQARAALETAFPAVFGRQIERLELAILLSQSEHETDEWRHMCGDRVWNFGGIKGAGDRGSIVQMTREGQGDHEVMIPQHFRRYSSPAAGCEDWLRVLLKRWPQAFDRARAGDPAGFVAAIHPSVGYQYFTGSPLEYSRAVAANAKRWLTEIDAAPGKAPTPAPVDEYPGWRRAKQIEVTGAMADAAFIALGGMKPGEFQPRQGFALACELGATGHKNITVLLRADK